MSKNRVKKLIKNNKILKKLEKKEVLKLSTYKKEIKFTEMCDEWFSAYLNKKEMENLAQLFTKLAKEMEENK